MNKRITGIALLVLLLFASGAWAASLKPSITIKTSSLPSSKVGNESYGENGTAPVQVAFTLISEDAVITVETVEVNGKTGAEADGTPDGTLLGTFSASLNSTGETDDTDHLASATDTFYVFGKVWGVGSIPVKVRVTATWTPTTTDDTTDETTGDENNTDENTGDDNTEDNTDTDNSVVITAEKTLTFTSTAYAPETITLVEAADAPAEDALPARKKNGETTFQSLVQDDGFVGLNTAHAVKDDANVFKTTATLPVTWSAVGLPAGLKFEISKIEFAEAEEDTDNTALPTRKKEELGAEANTEATSLANGGKSADITFKVTGTPTKAGAASVGITVANAGGSLPSDKHDLLVFAPAVFTTSEKLPEFTWGKEKTITLAATGGLTNYPITFDYADDDEDTPAILSALGLTFDTETGEITGTIDKNDAAYDVALATDEESLPAKKKEVAADDLKFGSEKTKTFTLKFKAISPGVATSEESSEDDDDNESLPAKKKDTAYDSDGLTVTKEFTLTVKAAAPSIVNKDDLQDKFESALENISISKETGAIVDDETNPLELKIMAEGPGDFEWTVKNLPAGLTSEDADDTEDDDDEGALPGVKKDDTTTVYGKYIIIKVAGETTEEARPAVKRGTEDDGESEINPANIVQVVKNWPITVSVKTPGGTDSVKLTANIGTGENQEFGITQERAALPAGVHNISQDISDVDLSAEDDTAEGPTTEEFIYKTKTVNGIALTAFPGPVTWKADNLPDGFVLSVDKKYPYGTRAILLGNYKTASKKANQVYKITATNTTLKTSSVVSNEVTVYGPPEITTKSLPDLTIGKKYSSKIAVKGLDISVDVTIEVSKDETVEEGAALPAKKTETTNTESDTEYCDKEFKAGEEGKYSLKFDATNFTLTGSFDKYWDDERTKILKVTIKAKNPGYNVEAEENEAEGNDGGTTSRPAVKRGSDEDDSDTAVGAGTVTTKVIALKIKPVAPAFKTTKLSDYYGFGDNVDADGSGKGHSITITGSKPMDLLVYVAGKDAKNIGLNTTGDDVVFYSSATAEASDTEEGAALPAKKKGDDETEEGTSTGPAFTVTTTDDDSETTTLNIGYAADQGWAFASLPITVSADNGSGTSKGVSKVFKVAVKGSSPSIVSMDEGNYLVLENKKSRDITINVEAGEAIPNYNLPSSGSALPAKKKVALDEAEAGILIFVSGDEPLTLTASQKFGVAKNGVTVDSIDLSAEEGYTDPGTPKKAFWIHGTAGTLATKETKTAITLTATNAQTKAKADCKVTIVGQLAPEITTKATAAKKEIEVGKSLSLRLAAKGTKPIMWKLVGDDEITNTDALPAKKRTETEGDSESTLTVADYEALLVNYGLSFDQKNGMFKGKAVYPTSDDATQKLYEPKVFNVVAYNDAGDSQPIAVTIGIKGKKPKLSSTLKAINLTISRDTIEDTTAGGTTGSRILKSDISYTDTKSYVSWDIVGTVASPLTGLKVGNSADVEDFKESGRSIGYLDLTDVADSLTSSKATTVKLKASNYGSEVTGSVKVTVNDPKPAFDTSSSTFFAQIEAQEKKDVTNKSVTLAVDDFSKSSNNTTLDWKILRKPTGKVTAAIKPASNQKSAAITITVKKGLASKDVHNSAKIEVDGEEVEDKIFHTSFTVQVMNKTTKELAVATVSVDVCPYDGDSSQFPTYTTDDDADDENGGEALPAQKDALPEDEELPVGEGTVTYGDARNESALTQAERRMLAEGGYIIAAILPEITTDESGQYDLEAVSLDEAALEGYELVWFAFPRNSEYSEDDTIAEFYDEAGAEVFAVPEGRIVVPAPWLEKDVTYAPVIAVKAPVAGEAKDSLDEAEAGDTVTEKAIEEAAESTAEGSEEAVTVSEESKHAEE